MVGKLPNCSQAQRSRTEERKRDLWIRQSPPEVKAELCSRHGVSQLQARAGCQKTKSSLRIERSIFFLTSPFIELSHRTATAGILAKNNNSSTLLLELLT